MARPNKESITEDLLELGIRKGDTLFIAADLLRVGYFSRNRDQTLSDWIDMLLSVVGEEGTLVIPAYTQSFLRFFKDKNIVYSINSVPTSGSLSLAFFKHPNVRRSKHPTNSCFAIGKNADYILQGHNERASSYMPYRRVVDCNGKNLMIGAFSDTRLSPMAFHLSQEHLGITKRHWLSGMIQSYYLDDAGKLGIFTRKDIGGCSSGGYKSYGHHILRNAIKLGTVGNSTAALIDCNKSSEIFMELLRNSPKLIRCDDKKCADCYGSPIYAHPLFWLKNIFIVISRAIHFGKLCITRPNEG